MAPISISLNHAAGAVVAPRGWIIRAAVLPVIAFHLTLAGALADPQRAADDADQLTLIDGASRTGRITAIENGVLQFAQGPEIALDGLLSLDRTGVPLEASTAGVELRTVAGGLIRARQVDIENEEAKVQTEWGRFAIPIESIRAVIFQTGIADELIERAIASPSSQLDTLIAKTDDGAASQLGLIQSVRGEELTGEFDGQKRSLNRNRLVAIVTADLNLPRDLGNAVTLRLTDGSRFQAKIRQLQGNELALDLVGGGELTLPWTTVRGFDVLSDRLVWLSSLEPIEAYQQSIIAQPMSWQRDRSVGGKPIRLHYPSTNETRTFSSGIGVHAYSRLTYALDVPFRRLVGTVGIDAETQGHGDCQFVVKADGLTIWTQRIQAQDDPLPLDVDITNAREISLIVEPGEMLDLADHADWANIRLLRD